MTLAWVQAVLCLTHAKVCPVEEMKGEWELVAKVEALAHTDGHMLLHVDRLFFLRWPIIRLIYASWEQGDPKGPNLLNCAVRP